MTAVTVTERKEIMGNISQQAIECTFTDGYTFQTKFSYIIAVFGNSRARAGTYCSVSGGVVTMNCSSASGDTGELLIIGY